MERIPMKRFIILFSEKEGTSPLVQLLNHFQRVSVLHQMGDVGWEPFDRHNCGPMKTRDLVRCLDLIFQPPPASLEALNRIYLKTAARPLEDFNPHHAVGFKMRFRPIRRSRLQQSCAAIPGAGRLLVRPWGQLAYRRYFRSVVAVLKKHQVRVLIAVRQDLFRWALSKYHGDGSGKPGHIQFKIASGALKRDQVPRIQVDPQRFRGLIKECESTVWAKIALMRSLRSAGLKVTPVYYEEFCGDKFSYFHRFFDAIGVPVTDGEIAQALAAGTKFEKVHAHEISTFVTNHQEIEREFGRIFMDFQTLAGAGL